MAKRKKGRRIKAASGRAQPRQISTRLTGGAQVWARPSGAQRPKSVNNVTEVEQTQGGAVTIRTKSGPRPYRAVKPNISRKKRGGPR